MRRFKVKKRGMKILSRDIQLYVESSMDLVSDQCEVCHQAEARRQEMKMEKWTEASLKAVFFADLRSLTFFCKQWEVVKIFKLVCNVDMAWRRAYVWS